MRHLLSSMRTAGLGLVLVGAAGMMAAALAGCKAEHPPIALKELTKQQMRGRTSFQAHCAMCHYDRQEGALHGPSMLGVFARPALPSGAAATDERVTDTIVHGHGLMPPMGGSMDPDDIGDVLAYLHTLSGR